MQDQSRRAALYSASRSFAKIARSWGDETAANIPYSKEENKAAMRAECCLFFTYAILCHRGGTLSLEDTKLLLQSLVLARHNRILDDDNGKSSVTNEQIERLTTTSACLLARRSHEMMKAINGDCMCDSFFNPRPILWHVAHLPFTDYTFDTSDTIPSSALRMRALVMCCQPKYLSMLNATSPFYPSLFRSDAHRSSTSGR